MTMFYVISKYITFPGAAIKVLWEHLAARIAGILIEDPKCFQKNELCGHLEHRLAGKTSSGFLFCFIPGVLNFLISLPLLFAGAVNLFYLGAGYRDIESGMVSISFFAFVLMFYFGVSLLCNLFPLYEDALNLWDKLYVEKEAGSAARILLFIPTCIIMAGAFIEKYAISFALCVIAVIALIII